MPSAAPDDEQRARFTADLDAGLQAAGLPCDTAVGIALSGGPDSSALLLLAARHATGQVAALTVDHGLRAASAEEAKAAASLCAGLGIAHETVAIVLAAGSVQAAARAARYAALAAWARRRGIAAVLTAHHADDQAETVLMRLRRGAGLAGLSGIRPIRPLDGGGDVLLLRPLLGWRKAELEAICAAAGVEPVRDPSNAQDRFDRTAARALLARTPWLDASRITASARYLGEAEATLAALADERYRMRMSEGEILLDPDPLPEIARRHLHRLLAEQFDAHPDGASLTRTMEMLRAGGSTTCADVLCRAGASVWSFRRAPPRRSR